MGYGIMPYAVDTKVLAAPHTFTGDPEGFLEWMQGLHCDSDEERQALRELFFRETPTLPEGHLYGYALKTLCERFGGPLDNGHWYLFGSKWCELVKDGLAEVGVRFDPNDLMWTGPPVSLPPIDDFPVIGHLLRAEMEPIAEAMAAADLSAISDRQVADASVELYGWMRFCLDAKAEDYDLVCFYH